jgi:hypothetical protein
MELPHDSGPEIVHVGLWRAKPRWTGLDRARRERYLADVGERLRDLRIAGARMLGASVCDPDVTMRLPYDYLSVWCFTDASMCRAYERLLEDAGWNLYFDQVNARGPLCVSASVLAHVAAHPH